MTETTLALPTQQRVALTLAVWAFAYACYRAYHAAGGTIGMIGQPVSAAQFRAINAYTCTPWSTAPWGALGIAFVAASRRRAWLVSAIAGCLLLTVVGVIERPVVKRPRCSTGDRLDRARDHLPADIACRADNQNPAQQRHE